VVINCAVCGKEKKIRPAKVKVKNFCSHACYWSDKNTQQSVECLYCFKKIKRTIGSIEKQGKNHFCNRKCLFNFKKGPHHPLWKEVQSRFCITCGKELPHRSATRERVKHCSISCSKKREKAPSWKGGIWGYNTDFEKRIRIQIRKRDGFCQICGIKSYGAKNLHVHHIDQNKKNDNPENLITLCPLCHKRVHLGKLNLNNGLRRGKSQLFL
jgi:5-methylcytosine-specific restriction endonuclease McrA